MRLEGRAPLRIDFGGGWTDVPLYAEEHGGAVFSTAITKYVKGHFARPDATGLLHALRGDRSYVSYRVDIPAGSGLGSSAAQRVLWLALLKTSTNNNASRTEIARIACDLSKALGILGGKQDEYAAALGGMHLFSFDASVRAQRTDLSLQLLENMRARLVLVYSGICRVSGAIHEAVWTSYRSGNPAVRPALDGLKRVAGDMARALAAEDLDEFSTLLSENWTYQKALHHSVSNSRLDDLFDFACAHGATGGKACGAGGGGCFIFMAGPGQSEALRTALRSRHVDIIDFDFDSYGVFIKKA